MAWVPPRVWSNETITDTKLNEISASLNALGGSTWSSYTPIWSATTTPPTMGTTIISGAYRENGGSVECEIVATVGSGFAAGSGIYTFTLPVTAGAVANQVLRGNAHFFDASGPGFWDYVAIRAGGVGVGLTVVLVSNNTRMSASVPVVPAAGDVISIALEYRK